MARSWKVKVIAGCVVMTALSRLGVPLALAEDAPESRGASAAYTAASTVLTVVHVPLKMALCGTSVMLGGLAYLLTFGRPAVARDASDTSKGVCTGPHIITPTQLRTAGEETMDSYGAE
jgi:hypothetical protein